MELQALTHPLMVFLTRDQQGFVGAMSVEPSLLLLRKEVPDHEEIDLGFDGSLSVNGNSRTGHHIAG